MSRTVQTLGVAALAIFLAASARAGNATLSFDSLPSAQGWTYFDNGFNLEADVFSVAGGVLSMDSSSVDAGYYYLGGVLDPALSFSMSMRARISSGGYSLAAYVASADQFVDFRLSPTSITSNVSGVTTEIAAVDNTQFHDYRIDGKFGETFTLFVDSAAVYTDTFRTGTVFGNLILGDDGSFGSGTAEVTTYSFRQPIPEPASWLLMIGGLLALAGCKRQAT